MRDILLISVVLAALPFVFRRPWFGLLLFTWFAYMNPHRLTWGIAYDLPFSAIIAALTFVSIFISRDIKKLPIQYPIFYIWIAWIIWMNFTTLFALEPDSAAWEWQRAVKIQLMSMVTIMLMQSKERIMLLTWVITLSIAFYGVKGGIFVLLTMGHHLVFGPEGTFFYGNNALAIALLMVLPLIWFLQSQMQSISLRLLFLGVATLCSFSIIASYSRGAFLAFCAVLFYFFLKSRRKLLIAPIVIMFAALLLSFMPEKYTERLETIQQYEEDGSAMGRINAWQFAYNVAKANPITGGGFGVFQRNQFLVYAPEPENYHDAHSIYFEVLGEHGFFGLTLFLLLGFSGLRMNANTAKLCKGRPELKWAASFSQMLYVCLIGYASGGLFLGLAYFDLYYHLLALTVLVRLEVDKYLEADTAKCDESLLKENQP